MRLERRCHLRGWRILVGLLDKREINILLVFN